MRDENELKLKRAYWSGVFYTLDPSKRNASAETRKVWHTAEIWITAIDWVLGKATDSATAFGLMDVDSHEWDT